MNVDYWKRHVTNNGSITDIPVKESSEIIGQLIEQGVITDENLDAVKAAKIAELSAVCSQIIITGSDVSLNDGNTYHFSFTMTDQTQISMLAIKAKNGETFLPWHSNGASCKLYSAEDILAINQAMETLVTYQVTYFNSLRDYVRSLEHVTDVVRVAYGADIPVEYQSEVLKFLLSHTGVNNEE